MWPDALLHLVPVQHGPEAEPYLALGFVVVGVAAAVVAGLLLARPARGTARREAAAIGFSAGALLFLFFDLLKEAAGLGQGLLSRPLLQAGLLGAFALGALSLPALARGRDPSTGLLWAWVIGLAAHGAGEGWIVGTEAATANLSSPTQAASFLLHKLAEAFTIPVVASIALQRGTVPKVTAAIALAALAAAAAGHFTGSGIPPLLLFSYGAGAAASAILHLGRLAPLTLRHAAAVLGGVLFIYGAGLLHEI